MNSYPAPSHLPAWFPVQADPGRHRADLGLQLRGGQRGGEGAALLLRLHRVQRKTAVIFTALTVSVGDSEDPAVTLLIFKLNIVFYYSCCVAFILYYCFLIHLILSMMFFFTFE